MDARLDPPPGRPILVIDAGARGGYKNRLLKRLRNVRYVGFEPDQKECDSLNDDVASRHQYFPVALGHAEGRRQLHVTKEPACSSFLAPNVPLLNQFANLSPQFEIARTIEIETTTLDAFLPARGIGYADFLKLDTQGTELEILEGADHLLRTSLLGVRVEVEFIPMYIDQPLFPDVDRFLRARDFDLFDLTRYRVRRRRYPRGSPTRGQLIWGQALYLKRADGLAASQRLRLAALAAALDFADYALQVVDTLVKEERVSLSAAERAWAKQTRARLRVAPERTGLARVAHRLEHSRLAPLWRRLASACTAVARVAAAEDRARANIWKD